MSYSVLVTGGAGFIGSHLASKLVSEGMRVVVIDDLSTGFRDYIHPEVLFYEQSILSSDLESLFRENCFDYVFHLAAQKSVPKSIKDPFADAQTNIMGSIRLLDCCSEYQVKKVIYSSTGGAIYGNAKNLPVTEKTPASPLSAYAISKATIEEYLRFYYQYRGLPYLSLRYSNVYGPRQDYRGEGGVIAIFMKQLLMGEEINIYGDGEQTRDFVFVQDIVDSNLKALSSNYIGEVNISSACEISINQLVEKMSLVLGKRNKVNYLPPIPGDVYRSCLDNTLAEEKLGWKVKIGIESGLERTKEWIELSLK